MMLGTMMTVFVSICKITLLICWAQMTGVNSGDVGHNDDSICKITLLI